MTPGPWEWWTSNSFRRLSAGGKDGAVLNAVVLRDGCADIQVSEADMAVIAAAPEMLAILHELRLYRFVIESAMRRTDPVNYPGVVALLDRVRALEPISPQPGGPSA